MNDSDQWFGCIVGASGQTPQIYEAFTNVGFSNWVFGSSSFSFLFRVIVTHPGHTSLRSLVDAVLVPLHAYVGSDVESLAQRRASRGAADTFGFLHEPRPVRDDPVRIGGRRFRLCLTSHLVLTGFRAINPHPV